jgi:acyl-CoA dehydrogenase
MSTINIAAPELVNRAEQIAEEIAGPHADDVDRDARFPVEAFDALREEHLLSILVPEELGGAGASISDTARICRALGAHCSSTGLIYAMHQMQVACVVRHGDNALLRQFLTELSECQYLLGSATTEVGVGGDIRTSLCAVQKTRSRFTLVKQAPVVSYGAYADAIMTTARRSPESAAGDQVLVLCRPPGLMLEQLSEWDTMGFRGTCSPGFELTASGDVAQILTSPFSEIAASTMLPVAHVLWSSVWLGIASAAVERARHFVRAEARRKPGVTPAGAVRLAELSAAHQEMSELIAGMASRYDLAVENPATFGTMTFAIAMNNLKVSASTMVVDIVGRALGICGMAGYRLDTAHSMSRLLRDAHGGALMVNNDRINANTAQMLLISKDL